MQGNLCRKRGYLTGTCIYDCYASVYVPSGIFSNNLFIFAETFTVDGSFVIIFVIDSLTFLIFKFGRPKHNQSTVFYFIAM